jgi:hypothetical protein
MKKDRVTGVQITIPSMRFFDYFFEFLKINFVTKRTAMKYLKNCIDNHIFLLNNIDF